MTNLKITISEHNDKTGNIPSFNTLAGKDEHFYRAPKELDGARVKGTCNNNCPGCYAAKLTRYPQIMIAYLHNTILATEHCTEMFEQLQAWLRLYEPRYFRYHDSGDIPSYEYLINMIKTAEKFDDITFYTYTKRFDYLRLLIKNGIDLPNNLIINLSSWTGETDDPTDIMKALNVNLYYYDDKKNSELPHCPAVDKDGKRTGVQCRQCKKCMRHGNATAVYPH